MADKNTAAHRFIDALPHARALGMHVETMRDGEVSLSMPYADHLVGDPRTGVVHGGAVSALMDTCCGAAVMTHPKNTGSTATIDLRIEYLRAATPGQTIIAKASCYHVTRSVAFVRATAMDADEDNPVAMATGTFTVEGKA
ncbi:PaaI family thioesterase [uncultured Sulfitobacter sp.]|uniref:PaaI family thioesterase n=1 Tax=uncultured Sulfitobacter sp. TaxID=191468 RepID=UPI00262313C4|nr:PaaI family thioesterase [uncultured Sulfitobacter sp.]